MDNTIASISEIQEAIKSELERNTYFANHGVEILIENAKDIEFQIKSAMSALGICATVATPSLTYGGNVKTEDADTSRPWWTISGGSVVIVENPTLNRGRPSYGTALDAALQVALTLHRIPSICDTTITQTTQGGLVVVSVQFKTNISFMLEYEEESSSSTEGI